MQRASFQALQQLLITFFYYCLIVHKNGDLYSSKRSVDDLAIGCSHDSPSHALCEHTDILRYVEGELGWDWDRGT